MNGSLLDLYCSDYSIVFQLIFARLKAIFSIDISASLLWGYYAYNENIYHVFLFFIIYKESKLYLINF